ncbi:MAG: DUF6538 domain-containing protein [Pseudomonadota bacterium]
MKLTLREQTYHIRKRVPRRYQRVEEREFIWLSLHTDSESHAKQRAPIIWQEMIEAWEAKLAGQTDDGDKRLAMAKELAARRGFRFMFAPAVARLPDEEFAKRMESVVTAKGNIDLPEADAVLGLVDKPAMTITRALQRFWVIASAKTIGKSNDQIRRWENPRKKAVAAYIKAVGNQELQDVTTADLVAFKTVLTKRIQAGEITASSANKDLIHLISTIRDVARAEDIALKFNAEKLMFKQDGDNTRPPFSADWIRDKILAPGALDGLNLEARCILLGMINTGYRPSEGAMLTAAHIHLDGKVPFIQIEAVGRTLKTKHSRRVIPLAGVSLEAFRQCPNGFPRYADKAGMSDTINKFLRENGLLQSDRHSLYSLRHSFEDRMLSVGVDERIRRDLMGHALQRMGYGDWAAMDHLLAVVESVAL